RVFAGTQNLTGALEVTVESAGASSLIGRVGQIVREAQQTRAPIIRLTEQYASYYTPLILMIAAFVLFFTGDMMRAIAVIIVSIPCAFVLAGPATMVAALAAASRLGILVKSVRFFETATGIDTVVFDKTGTLTHGQLHLARLVPHGACSENEALALAAGAEANSTHPVARAVVAAAQKRGLNLPAATDVAEEPGRGVRATVGGRRVLIGRRGWVESRDEFAGSFGAAETAGASELVLAIDGRPAATMLLADNLRDEARSIGARLGEAGIGRFTMLTGDNRQVADAIAAEVGFTDVAAECLPEDKLNRVHALKAEGRRVAVVGDGINDAPALAAGDLSVAMGAAGSDIAIQTADIALMNNDLHRLPALFRLSRRAIGVINQNLLVGLIFVVIAIVLAALGIVGPIGAAILHEISAFFVIFNSARLLRFEEA
ncbi:MAG: heavy metal translocating P-type ATPase, partial [Verrucomicrobiota bacterium]